MYLSYVLGDDVVRANRIVLSRNEIKVRAQRVKMAQMGFLLVTSPENRPDYDAYVADVRFVLQNGVRIKLEPIIVDEDGSSDENQ